MEINTKWVRYTVYYEKMTIEIEFYNVHTGYWFKAIRIKPNSIIGVFDIAELSSNGRAANIRLCDSVQDIHADMIHIMYHRNIIFTNEFDDLLESWFLMGGLAR